MTDSPECCPTSQACASDAGPDHPDVSWHWIVRDPAALGWRCEQE